MTMERSYRKIISHAYSVFDIRQRDVSKVSTTSQIRFPDTILFFYDSTIFIVSLLADVGKNYEDFYDCQDSRMKGIYRGGI